MARYTGPKTKISRRFGEPILGNGKWLEILVFGPVYLAIVFIHFDFFCNGATIGKKS